jgi:hypothetical protein
VGRAGDSVLCRLCGERFRLITPTHLWHRHRWSGSRPSELYKKRFGVATVWSDASRRAMSESLESHYDRKGRLWTRRRIVAAVARRVRAGRPLRFRDVWRDEPELYWTAQRLFGSWEEALRAAGVEPPPWPEWTRERIVGEIRRRAKAGRSVRYASVFRDSKPLYWAGQRVLGSWQAALRAAGVSGPPGSRRGSPPTSRGRRPGRP